MVPKVGSPEFFVTVNIKGDVPVHLHIHVHENLSFTNSTMEHSSHGLARQKSL